MYVLEIDKVSKIYDKNIIALEEVSFNIEEGDFYALLGHNGAGKSTLINIISSITDATSGSIKIMGQDLFTQGHLVRPYLGIVNQEFNFSHNATVKSILFFNATFFGMNFVQARKVVDYWIKRLDLEAFKDRVAYSLSGGLKRRVMIARALLHNPKILILDEPTAGVDVHLRRELWDLLIKLNQSGTTIILTTHYLEEAEYLCRNIGIISKGKLVANTSMRKFLSDQPEEESFIMDLAQPLIGDFVLENEFFKLHKINDEQLEVLISPAASLNQVFQCLEQHQLTITSLRNGENRLEKVFMRYDL